MISIEEINLLKGQNEALLKQNKDLQKQVLNLKSENADLKALIAQRNESITVQSEIILNLKAENERLGEEKSKLLSKCIDKQCRINELINIVSTKEFTLKVNGKKYEGLNGIDQAKIFINNENAVRDNYIQKLENKISELQCKFYENCKKVVNSQKQIDKYRQTLQEIKAIVTEPCIDSENCLTCKSNCMNKDILDLITKAESEKQTNEK